MSKTQDCLLVTKHGGATNLSKSTVKNWTTQITAVLNSAEFPTFATFKHLILRYCKVYLWRQINICFS